MMDIPNLLDLGIEIETHLSHLYEQLAANSKDLPIANRLLPISKEELNHANILRRGKQYYEMMPDLFTGVTINTDELEAELEESKIFQTSLGQGKVLLLHGLEKMLGFEKTFEKVHLATSMKISESSLKKLFVNLSKGDHSHTLILKGLIESFLKDAK